MKISLNTMKSLISSELPPLDILLDKINTQLGGVEEVIELGDKYRNARIVKIVQCNKHPDADKLSVCLVDDGGVVDDIERSEDGLVQVVCGAPNVKDGMWAVWLPPRSIVPSTFNDTEPFMLDARKLRGVMSYGMLAAGDELAINNDHDGVVEITETDMKYGHALVPGANFGEVFGLNDTIIDIENKMFTHRPDCFGQLGVAREIAAIIADDATDTSADDDVVRFVNPPWYDSIAGSPQSIDDQTMTVFNESTENVPRFMTVVMDNVKVGSSPLWLQAELVRWGSKAINNVVDITNWIMLYTAQPTHAYDYSTLHGNAIGARMARQDETITLLNDKTYTLSVDDIVIADGERAIGLAGIMGGSDSEVTDKTTTIVVEVANFDMYTLRKTAMRHGIFTDALTRFNKGQSPLQTGNVLRQLMTLFEEHASAKQVSPVYDLVSDAVNVNAPSLNNELSIRVDFINQRLGSDLSVEQIIKILKRVQFTCRVSDEHDATIMVTAPYWRTDIELREDIVEEVGRLYGFDKLPRALPLRSSKPAPKNSDIVLKQKLRDSMQRVGANEVLTYSFVNEKVLLNAQQDPSHAFRLSNALSPDLQFYRLTVLPSLLGKVHINIKAGHDEFVLYEIGKGHNKESYSTQDNDDLPAEHNYLDMVYTSKNPKQGAAYYHMSTMISQVAKDLGIVLHFEADITEVDRCVSAPFEPRRSARIIADNGVCVGIVGEVKVDVAKSFKLPEYTAAASLDFAALKRVYELPRLAYTPLSRYPRSERDVSFRVFEATSYADVHNVLVDAIGKSTDVQVSVQLIDIFMKDKESDYKNMTFRFTVQSHDKTLSGDEVTAVVTKISDYVVHEFDAEIV